MEDNMENTRQRIIDGLFYSPFRDEVAQFTGLFSESKNSITGLLDDYYGRSRIEGTLAEEDSLVFTKTYGGRPPIQYDFKFNKDVGLYVGTWKGKDAFEGHSVCRLDSNLTQQDANWIVSHFRSFPMMTNEDRASAVIDTMVDLGYLAEVIPDSNSTT